MKINKQELIFIVAAIFASFISVTFWMGRNAEMIVTESSTKQERIETKPETEQNQDQIAIADSLSKSFSVPPEQLLFDVPFAAQAPFGDWADARQDSGCEEAAMLMAMYWVYGRSLPFEIAEKEIIAISEFEQEQYGDFHNTSALDTLKVLKAYFKYENAFAKFDIGIEDIKAELVRGNLVLVPIDGTKVGNLYYTPPGPTKHKIIIRGYDDNAQEFITNDPGTKQGEGYRYGYQILEDALLDYPTGFDEPIDEIRTAMIVVEKL